MKPGYNTWQRAQKYKKTFYFLDLFFLHKCEFISCTLIAQLFTLVAVVVLSEALSFLFYFRVDDLVLSLYWPMNHQNVLESVS